MSASQVNPEYDLLEKKYLKVSKFKNTHIILMYIRKGILYFAQSMTTPKCSVSRWRPQKVDKRMVLEYTHGLFIT